MQHNLNLPSFFSVTFHDSPYHLLVFGLWLVFYLLFYLFITRHKMFGSFLCKHLIWICIALEMFL